MAPEVVYPPHITRGGNAATTILDDWLVMGTPEIARMPLDELKTRRGRRIRRFYNVSAEAKNFHSDDPDVVSGQCPVPSTGSRNIGFCFRDLTRFLEEARRDDEPVLVYSPLRPFHAATCLSAYLMALDNLEVRQACEFVRKRSPAGFVPNEEHLEALHSYATLLKTMAAAAVSHLPKGRSNMPLTPATAIYHSTASISRRQVSHPDFPSTAPTDPAVFAGGAASAAAPAAAARFSELARDRETVEPAATAWPTQSDDGRDLPVRPTATAGPTWGSWVAWGAKKLVGLQ